MYVHEGATVQKLSHVSSFPLAMACLDDVWLAAAFSGPPTQASEHSLRVFGTSLPSFLLLVYYEHATFSFSSSLSLSLHLHLHLFLSIVVHCALQYTCPLLALLPAASGHSKGQALVVPSTYVTDRQLPPTMASSQPPSNGSSRSSMNPFAKRDEHSSQAILLYKITTSLSYVLLVVTTFYYTFHAPKGHGNHRFWHNNPPTPFAQSSLFTSIYWLILFTAQLLYAYALYTSDAVYVTSAANIGSHFIANNLLLFGFVNLFVRSHFWLAEVLLVINFFNLSFAYFRHSTSPRTIHIGTVSGPLAWNFVALYWVGAVAVHTNHEAARNRAQNIIWGWLAYGMFLMFAYNDYTMSCALSLLSFCKSCSHPQQVISRVLKPRKLSHITNNVILATGVGQFLTRPHILQLQWIFAFSIGGLLFVLSLAVAMPGLLGRDPFPRGQIVSEERERAPLLADD